jgi:diguanylate cyclase (GGDEF)-like protein
MPAASRGPLQRAGLGRRGWPYAVALGSAVALAVPGAERPAWLAAGAALLAAVVVAGWFGPWERLPRLAQLAPPLLACAGVMVLREAHASVSPGVAPFLLTPVVWLAVYGTAAEAMVGVAAAGASLALPVALWPHLYPVDELRRAAAYAAVGVLLTVMIRGNRFSAVVDPLTGLASRGAGEEALRLELERARRLRVPVALALLDLDHFKDFNDAHGHAAGDRVLTETGGVFREHLRTADLVARWGGEEILVATAGVTPERLVVALRRVRDRMPDGVTFSAGVVAWDGREDGGTLVGRADAALYRAKAAGRDRALVGEGPAGAPALHRLGTPADDGGRARADAGRGASAGHEPPPGATAPA